MNNITPDWQPSELIISGPYRCGKTVSIMMMIHRQLINNPGMYAMVVRPTYASVRSSLIPQFRDKILQHAFRPHLKNPIARAYGGETPSEIIYKNGARMFFGGMDRDPQKVLGGEYDIIFYNQVEQGEKEHWELLASRMLEARHGKWLNPYGERSLLIGDCNPSRLRHWILERAREENNLEFIKVGLDINPDLYDGLEWTEKGLRYIEQTKRTLTGLQLLRGLYGHWVSPEGIVYPQYDPGIHDIDQSDIEAQIDDSWEWTAAADHGDVNPFVFQLYCGPPDRSVVYLYKEIYTIESDIDEKKRMVHDLLDTFVYSKGRRLLFCIGDHDEGDNVALQKLFPDFRVEPADKKIIPGIQVVKNTLANVKVRFNKTSLFNEIHPKLRGAGNPVRTVEEFDRYVYKDESKMNGSDDDEKPQKGFDHGLDALRYHLVKWMKKRVIPRVVCRSIPPRNRNRERIR